MDFFWLLLLVTLPPIAPWFSEKLPLLETSHENLPEMAPFSTEPSGGKIYWMKITSFVDCFLEPETSIYKWLFQLDDTNLYIGNGCFTKHPFKTGCLGFQVVFYPFSRKRHVNLEFGFLILCVCLVGDVFLRIRSTMGCDAPWKKTPFGRNFFVMFSNNQTLQF